MKTLDLQEASDNAMLALLASLLVEDAQKEAEKQADLPKTESYRNMPG